MNFRTISLAVAVFLWASQACAVTDDQFDRIQAVGGLNGIALHCGYVAETRRMKEALVANLPKVRALGRAFDDKTNDAFLVFSQAETPCPSSTAFAKQVDAAVEALTRAFAKD